LQKESPGFSPVRKSTNIFLWISLLTPEAFRLAPTLVAGTLLGFFAFALLDEAIVVRRFRLRMAMLVFARKPRVAHPFGATQPARATPPAI
jgi:hypothetical protein